MDKAFVKGLRLIEALAQSETPRGVTDLATELSLTKSNVHRLLTTLQVHGYVRQVPVFSTYELTTKIWELGSQTIRRMGLLKIARPAMLKLAEKTTETVHLSILDDTEVVYVDKIESPHHIRAHTSVGSRAPAWAVATGKAMLAQMPDAYLERFDGQFHKFTETSKASLAELRQDLEVIRRDGYCEVYHGEWREGIAAVACAILDSSNKLVGAIGVSGPDSRLKRRQLQAFAPYVPEAARDISRSLGHSSDLG
ncbi:MAG TPA: IclR family transcriptional regulator [Devosia sp.]|nr:IclR family transcriptional regulator [Devosia sp.]